MNHRNESKSIWFQPNKRCIYYHAPLHICYWVSEGLYHIHQIIRFGTRMYYTSNEITRNQKSVLFAGCAAWLKRRNKQSDLIYDLFNENN
jgi:hypothetical protein